MESNDKLTDFLSFNPLNYSVCLLKPLRLVLPGGWIEHIPFAMFLIDLIRPNLLVELGTHSGNSYCAFCQAIKETKIETRCFAVDTWEGDVQAGYYGPEVLNDLRAHHDPLYSQFSSLIQSTFDDAVNFFSDGSIDLLHIDGFHKYEAVKHDFELWTPKLSQRSVVLFHDIAVRGNGFGVWKLWDDLKTVYPSFELLYGNGLGVLAIGKDYPSSLDILVKPSKEISHIRDFFYRLGSGLDKELYINTLTTQKYEKEKTIQTLTAQVMDLEQSVQILTVQLADREQNIQTLTTQVMDLEQSVQSLTIQLADREQNIQTLTTQLMKCEKEKESIISNKCCRIKKLLKKLKLFFERGK